MWLTEFGLERHVLFEGPSGSNIFAYGDLYILQVSHYSLFLTLDHLKLSLAPEGILIYDLGL